MLVSGSLVSFDSLETRIGEIIFIFRKQNQNSTFTRISFYYRIGPCHHGHGMVTWSVVTALIRNDDGTAKRPLTHNVALSSKAKIRSRIIHINFKTEKLRTRFCQEIPETLVEKY